jgi:hypothetical protein
VDRAPPFGLDDPLGLRGIVMLAQVKDRDVRALPGEQRRDGAADAAVRTGDQRDLALEPPRTRITRLPVRLRLELAFMPGKGISWIISMVSCRT